MQYIQNISQELTDAGIKPSYQRIKIYDFLLKHNIHPTVDMIYQKLSKEIPTLSKTTVYNTLKLFEEFHLIKNIKIEETESRYDAVKRIHGHFKCEQCNKIYDFDYNFDDLRYKGLENFTLNQTDIMIKGICKSCLQKDKTNK